MSLSRKIVLVVMVMGLMYYIDPSRADDVLDSFEPEIVEQPLKEQPESLEWGQELDSSENLCDVDSEIDNRRRNDLCRSPDVESSPVKKNLPTKDQGLIRSQDPQHFKVKEK